MSNSDEGSDIDTPSSDLEPMPSYRTLTRGPFAGVAFPNESARANALHIVREHVSTYLITHPHLDHVSGFVINTAAFHNTSRPKRLAALPFTVNAIKTHIFNNILWPNLTDEDGGVGLVTFQRLQEGGNIALGEGSGRGYIEVCDGLGVRGFKVSHGHCMRGPGHVHRGSNAPQTEPSGIGMHRASSHYMTPQQFDSLPDAREARSLSFSYAPQSAPGTPLYSGPGAALDTTPRNPSVAHPIPENHCVIDSTAYFIRAEASPTTPTREVLMFGDVEPDSISLSPRTALVWAEAAPKIAAGILTGIFIECSYSNAQGDAVLYGHLAPRHLLAELQNLGDLVRDARREHEKGREEARKGRKRKRRSEGVGGGIALDGSSMPDARKSSRSRAYVPDASPVHTPARASAHARVPDEESSTDYAPSPHAHAQSHTQSHSHSHTHNTPSVSAEHSRALLAAGLEAPLKGLKVVVMHVKDSMSDGPLVGDVILRELREGERAAAEKGRGLGCVFEVARGGGSYWF